MPVFIFRAGFALPAFLLVAAPALAQTPAAPPAKPAPSVKPVAPAAKLPAGVVARVNGKAITYAALDTKLKQWAGRPLLQQVIQSELIEQAAKQYGVSVSPAELASEVFRIKQEQTDQARSSGAGMMTWGQIAARDGVSESFVTDNVRLGLLARKAYAKFIESRVPSLDGQIKVAHIVLSNLPAAPPKDGDAPDTPEAKAKRDADALAKAQSILADIAAKKITFEDAAKQFSADRGQDGQGSAANGGVLPWMPRKLPNGQPPADPAFVDAAFALAKPGDITTAPVKAPYGYHLIKLIQKGDDTPDAEKAAYRKEQIDRQLANQQGVSQWINYTLQTAKIEYDIPVPVPVAPPKPVAPKPAAPPAKPAPAAPPKP